MVVSNFISHNVFGKLGLGCVRPLFLSGERGGSCLRRHLRRRECRFRGGELVRKR